MKQNTTPHNYITINIFLNFYIQQFGNKYFSTVLHLYITILISQAPSTGKHVTFIFCTALP